MVSTYIAQPQYCLHDSKNVVVYRELMSEYMVRLVESRPVMCVVCCLALAI
jgi:hypothetical protein